MELTRFRREIRNGGTRAHNDAQRLLDLVDIFRENAERFESSLLYHKQNEKNIISDSIAGFARENAALFLKEILKISTIQIEDIFANLDEHWVFYDIISNLVDRYDYPDIEEALNRRAQSDIAAELYEPPEL